MDCMCSRKTHAYTNFLDKAISRIQACAWFENTELSFVGNYIVYATSAWVKFIHGNEQTAARKMLKDENKNSGTVDESSSSPYESGLYTVRI